ncbi:MAG TPA: polysaccharide deacetylase family protein [Bacteroidales bacterium]|nr:polysaccharide deacetylase family protein [Bacteroidales bacterium]
MIPIKLRIIREKNRAYRLLLKFLSAFTPDAPKVYVFHDILSDISQVSSKFQFSKSSFERFIEIQLKSGNKAMTFQELSDIILKGKKRKNVFIVTFDDINESVYTEAFPILTKYNIPFVLFVTKELIGKPNFISKEQLIELSKNNLCTIGSHGLTHRMFRYLDEGEMKREYEDSKLFLEELTGKKVECFAFPYGRVVECSRKNINYLKNSVYKFAFSAIDGTLAQKYISTKFFLSRIIVDESKA